MTTVLCLDRSPDGEETCVLPGQHGGTHRGDDGSRWARSREQITYPPLDPRVRAALVASRALIIECVLWRRAESVVALIDAVLGPGTPHNDHPAPAPQLPEAIRLLLGARGYVAERACEDEEPAAITVLKARLRGVVGWTAKSLLAGIDVELLEHMKALSAPKE